MRAKRSSSISYRILCSYFVAALILYFPHATAVTAFGDGDDVVPVSDGPIARKDERWPLVSSEYGEISAVKISDGKDGCYHLHFISMEPRSMFLPVQLYSEMVLHVNSGNGTLSWIEVEEDEYQLQLLKLQPGDIYRLQPQTVFYMENNLQSEDKLQICALFPDSGNELQNKELSEVYSSIHDLVLGFSDRVLQATLSVPEDVIQELRGGETQPLIVQGRSEANNSISEVNSPVIKAFLGLRKHYDIYNIVNKKKKKKDKKKKDKKEKEEEEKEEKEAYNIFNADRDVENEHGWSATVTNEQLAALKDSNFGVFMVNLTEGSMMGPHWNPTSTEITIVQHGRGLIEVVCPSIVSKTMCKNSRFRVGEGDVFVVPRYHPTAQMSFNNESFVFMGFTMTSQTNPRKYLGGKKSILQTLDKTVLAKSFDVGNTTMMDEVMTIENEMIILECKSCAEDEEKLMGEEAARERGGGGGIEGQHWADMKGGSGSQHWSDIEEGGSELQWVDTEGEMARRAEDEMQRRLLEAEEAAKRVREAWGRVKAGEGCSCHCQEIK